MAVSHPVDAELAGVLKRVVSDGIIAPGYDDGVVEILAAKKRGTYLVLEADPGFEPPAEEVREIYGMRLTQQRDDLPLPDGLSDDLKLGMIVARYTQSNTIVLVKDGMTIGVGAASSPGSTAPGWQARRPRSGGHAVRGSR